MSQAKPDIPGYRILRRLGHGGMSEIWLAEQVALARPVAVKIVNRGEEVEARLARFRQEAAIIARFDHPNVVGIIEFGETADGRLFFSMPYVPNGTLAQASLHGDSPRLREVLAQVLEALAYIHEHGVVHRDVKPENVLFDSVGRARLADFGVSRSISGVSRHTRVGETFGSSHYMSPEQARGELPDGRGDLYGLGVIAYELLTGGPPYQGPDHLSVVVAHLQSPIPRLPEHLRQWQPWIDTALAKRPEHRYADAGAMRAALARIPEHPHDAFWLTRPWPLVLRAGVPAMIVLAVLLAIWRFSVVNDETDPEVGTAQAQAGATAVALPTPVAQATPPNTVVPMAVAPSPQAAIPPVSPAIPAATAPVVDAAASSPAGTATVSSQADAPAVPTTNEAAPSPVKPAAIDGDRPAVRSVTAPPRAKPATADRHSQPVATHAVSGFDSVPRIPLFVLSGTRDERLQRIDEQLQSGRRRIEADRVNVERLRRDSDDPELRRRLRDDYDARKANYETWRRQLLALRERAERGR